MRESATALALGAILFAVPPVVHSEDSLVGARVHGVVTDIDGAAFPDVLVSIYSPALPGPRQELLTRSDETGSFEFTNLPCGDYVIEATFGDHLSPNWLFGLGENQEYLFNITLVEGRDPNHEWMTAEERAALKHRESLAPLEGTGRIIGFVRDLSGDPVAEMDVWVRSSTGDSVPSARTDASS